MDLWYIPTISEYIKLLIKPVLYKIKPEEATKILEDFDPSVKKLFLTKGIINILPDKVQCMLLPAEEKILKLSSGSEEENISGSTRHEVKENSIQIYNPSNKLLNNDIISECSQLENSNDKLQVYVKNSHDFLNNGAESKLEKLDKFEKYSQGKINLDTFQNIINDLYEVEVPLLNNQNSKRKMISDSVCDEFEEPLRAEKVNDYRFYEIDDEIIGKKVYKTKVLYSSDKQDDSHPKIVLTRRASTKDVNTFYWDNLDVYYHREAKKALKLENEGKVR